MNTIFTTISKDYVRDWDVTEGVRELIQNALDGEDEGYKMGVSYLRKSHTLVVYNTGAVLPLNSLLLGTTTKADNCNLRGTYGEGFKIGVLALIRAGKCVTIHNSENDERWHCTIANHPEFNGDVLAFEILNGKKRSFDGKLVFKIEGITPSEWNDLKLHFLPIYEPDKQLLIKSPHGTVLKGEIFKGRIYSGGIYVDTHKDLEYGYDFSASELPLNRDRNMANSFDVQWATSKIWAHLSVDKKTTLDPVNKLLKQGASDVCHVDNFLPSKAVDGITEAFFEDNKDEKSYPVTDNDEAKEVKICGYKPIITKRPHANILRRKLGNIAELEQESHLDYQLCNGTESSPVINDIITIMSGLDSTFRLNISIAKFTTSTNAVVDGDKIIINVDILDNKYLVLYEVVKYYSELKDNYESKVWMELYENLDKSRRLINA